MKPSRHLLIGAYVCLGAGTGSVFLGYVDRGWKLICLSSAVALISWVQFLFREQDKG